MKKKRPPRGVVHGPKTAFESARDDFTSQLFTYQGWDSEFSPNPHEPPNVDALVPFGAQAVPVFVDLLDSTLWGHASWGFSGLRALGLAGVDAALAELERRVDHPRYGSDAREVLAAIRPERFRALQLKRTPEGAASSMRTAVAAGTGGAFLRALMNEGEEALVLAALETVFDPPKDPELVGALREVLLKPWPKARGRAISLLARAPGVVAVEALIEGMVTSGQVSLPEAWAWHPDSGRLVPLLLRNGNIKWLADLLERRRCAGLPVRFEGVSAFVEEKLRRPKREWRYEEHEVHDAARAALQLADPALLPALVDAVNEQNAGYAWEPLAEALRFFGADAVSALEQRRAASPGVRQVPWMLERLERKPYDQVELGDFSFGRGSIDHTTGGAFASYSLALRARPSAHAAFMLAWIDRAFGAFLSDDRARWIRSLGFRDDALLRELVTLVTPLEGFRHRWRSCDHSDAARVAAAGLPGLAYLGSRDERHLQQAHALLERVRAATAPLTPTVS